MRLIKDLETQQGSKIGLLHIPSKVVDTFFEKIPRK